MNSSSTLRSIFLCGMFGMIPLPGHASGLERTVALPYQYDGSSQGVIMPRCSSAQYLAVSNEALICKSFPACPSGQFLTFDGTAFSCGAATAVVNNTTTPPSAATCTANPAICSAYQTTTGRAPDAQGAAYWTTEYNTYVAAGLSAADAQAKILHDMSGTPEAQNYAATGQANASVGYAATGLNPTSSPTCSGGTNCNTTATSTASTAPDPITQAYQQLLGRTPDQAGAAYYAQQTQGMTAAQAAAFLQSAIGSSPEAKAHQATGTAQLGVGYQSNGTNATTSPLCVGGVNCK